MQENEKEEHESQPEPEMQPGTKGEATHEQTELETQPQPAPTSLPGQPSSTSKEKTWQFLLGLGIGLVPLVLFFIGFAPNAYGLIIFSLLLLFVIFIASLVCISTPGARYIGYGLLTAIPIFIVVGSIGCNVINSLPRA